MGRSIMVVWKRASGFEGYGLVMHSGEVRSEEEEEEEERRRRVGGNWVKRIIFEENQKGSIRGKLNG